MNHAPKNLDAMLELKRLGLPPTQTLIVQIALILQEFARADHEKLGDLPFEQWSVTDICRAFNIEVSA